MRLYTSQGSQEFCEEFLSEENMKKKTLCMTLVALLLLGSVGGCAKIRNAFQKWKGSLIGLEFDIYTYDDYGNMTLTVHGKNVDVEVKEEEGSAEADYTSEVLDITIDGNQMLQIGNTMIFAEAGLDQVTDFEMQGEIDASDGMINYIPFDRALNKFKNDIGKAKTILISSQQGIPIAVYQGESVYVEIPNDLPKMTRLNIDGKSLYIHRANYVILDSEMIE